MRDKAHKRLVEMINSGDPLPFDLNGSAIYYCGPAPCPPGKICGSIGPTTSSRMDIYTPALLDLGLKVMIGKGERNSTVIEAIKKHKALYLVTIGGAAALLAQSVISFEVFAWEDLGTEAIYKLVVKDFPAYVKEL